MDCSTTHTCPNGQLIGILKSVGWVLRATSLLSRCVIDLSPRTRRRGPLRRAQVFLQPVRNVQITARARCRSVDTSGGALESVPVHTQCIATVALRVYRTHVNLSPALLVFAVDTDLSHRSMLARVACCSKRRLRQR